MNGGDIFTNDECHDNDDGCSYWETFENNFNSLKSESFESINDVVCVGEKKNNINARIEGGGFVVTGAPELNDTINSEHKPPCFGSSKSFPCRARIDSRTLPFQPCDSTDPCSHHSLQHSFVRYLDCILV